MFPIIHNKHTIGLNMRPKANNKYPKYLNGEFTISAILFHYFELLIPVSVNCDR